VVVVLILRCRRWTDVARGVRARRHLMATSNDAVSSLIIIICTILRSDSVACVGKWCDAASKDQRSEHGGLIHFQAAV